MMKLAALALMLTILMPTLAAQATANFSGKWEGTFIMQRPDGTDAPARAVVFTLTHKGDALTGTAGPPEQQWEITKADVAKGTATFRLERPDGPLFTFTLKVVEDRLQGEMAAEDDGVKRTARVDAARAK